jgi:hypothetical protein
MITPEQLKILVAAAEIIDAIRVDLRMDTRLVPGDPVGQLSNLAIDLHLVIASFQDLLELTYRR